MSLDFTSKKLKKQHRAARAISYTVVVLLIVFSLFVGSSYAYQSYYKDKVYPGVYVGTYHLGGMTSSQLIDFIEKFNNRITKEGLDFSFTDKKNKEQKFKLNTLSNADSSVELVKLDSKKLATTALNKGKKESWFKKVYKPFVYRLFNHQRLQADVKISDELTKDLTSYLADYCDKPTDAGVKIESTTPLKYKIIPEKHGTVFLYDNAKSELSANLSYLRLATVEVHRNNFSPQVTSSTVKEIIDKLAPVLSYGNLSLNYIDSKTKIRRDWTITPGIYKEWIEVKKDKDNNLVFGFSRKEVDKYFKGLKPYVEQSALNAKFEMENNKVKKFQASQNGIAIDEDKTFSDLEAAFVERNFKPDKVTKTVNVAVKVTEPKTKMSDANDLGIGEIIGIGVSTFRDSHTNRIKNIANAVARLNGTLIKPGEVFSTNKYAGPYTTASGFLPEDVIIGNKIKKEVGGGMCQIGTTMFRMAMNSGMPINQRANHSLVVHYYADPVNGNPGTDATVYEPYVDFKFDNDTGNYMLLQTSIDYKKQELTFTLWGKNDGRKGSYTHPLVSSWYSPGDPIVNKTTSLKPGKKVCQAAFTGAKASFTYTRFTSSSKQLERVFESYYRPLPQICSLGVDSNEYCTGEGKDTEDCKDFEGNTASSTQNQI
mgnify:CR=1 FL=1